MGLGGLCRLGSAPGGRVSLGSPAEGAPPSGSADAVVMGEHSNTGAGIEVEVTQAVGERLAQEDSVHQVGDEIRG